MRLRADQVLKIPPVSRRQLSGLHQGLLILRADFRADKTHSAHQLGIKSQDPFVQVLIMGIIVIHGNSQFAVIPRKNRQCIQLPVQVQTGVNRLRSIQLSFIFFLNSFRQFLHPLSI